MSPPQVSKMLPRGGAACMIDEIIPTGKMAEPKPFFHDQRYASFVERKAFMTKLKVEHSFFVPHQGINNATTSVEGRELVNFSSYNYLALAGTEEVSAAAMQAIDR